MVFLLEIRFHGRGGQGAVTAANLFASAALKSGNKDVQASPFFGAERRGAPVKAFARISDEQINLRSQIYEPDMVVVLDPYLLELVEVTEGLKPGGTFLLNTRKRPEELLEFDKFRVATVNATDIALKHGIKVGGIPVVNTAILGAISKVVSKVTLKAIIQTIKDRFKGEQGEINAEAAREAYDNILVKR
jgi:pyruvate ferredoxin oxidoreductase gamma subunit/2-oxoisovalerate ferredoxin oxidoreductase gamma subunit